MAQAIEPLHWTITRPWPFAEKILLCSRFFILFKGRATKCWQQQFLFAFFDISVLQGLARECIERSLVFFSVYK